MKKETIIIIVGIIALALLYYFTSKKSVTVATNQTGLIPSATSAINKLGSAVSVTSTDISSVIGALTGLLGKKASESSSTDVAGGDVSSTSGLAYMGDDQLLYS
jgi:hypothetical protein